MEKIIKQIFKFGIVGGICFLIDYIILFICTDIFNIYYLISSIISFTISTIFNYILSVKWVFNVKRQNEKKKKFIIFVTFSVIGLILNQIIMWFGVEILSIYYMITKIISTIIVMVFNFITRKIFLEK